MKETSWLSPGWILSHISGNIRPSWLTFALWVFGGGLSPGKWLSSHGEIELESGCLLSSGGARCTLSAPVLMVPSALVASLEM